MRQSNRMILLILATILLISGLVTANVFLVAVVKVHARSGTDLTDYVSASNVHRTVQQARRGYILDRNGTIIAQDNVTYNIIAILDKNRQSRKGEIAYVDDPLATARALAPILGMEESTLYGYLTKNAKQVELGSKGRNLPRETKEAIEALDLNGIEFVQTTKRSYPLGTFASYLIGFAQADDDGEVSGRMGIEQYMNAALSGEDGYKRYQADKNGNILPGMKMEEKSAVNGNDVILTLDQGIQEALETAFMQTQAEFNPEKVWGSVMEVETGKILAWGQSPSFDPNTMDIDDYVNYVSQMPYEPGSTMKVFTYAAAIDSGAYDGSVLVDSCGFVTRRPTGSHIVFPRAILQDRLHRQCSGKSWGMILRSGLSPFVQRVTASIITNLIEPSVYEEYLDRFGFFKLVDTDGIAESTGVKNFTWPADKLALTYGQGSTVTMLQMIQAYSAIFNDGTMVKPYVIDQVRSSYDDQNVLYQGQTQVVGNPISVETSKQVQQLMYDTANREDGTARFYQIPETTIIAKTGTTQLAAVGGGGYSTGKTIVSLMAAMPAEDPKVLVYYAFQADYDKNAHVKSDAIKSVLRKVA
ncbi:MAG: peptidoglycan D,D-transpeptidase FtsI family protein [Holdemania filiformis]